MGCPSLLKPEERAHNLRREGVMPGLTNTDAPPELREGVDSDAESGEDEFVAGLGTEEEAEALWVGAPSPRPPCRLPTK